MCEKEDFCCPLWRKKDAGIVKFDCVTKENVDARIPTHTILVWTVDSGEWRYTSDMNLAFSPPQQQVQLLDSFL